MFEDKNKFYELFSSAVSEAVQLRLLDIVADENRKTVLEATVKELAEMINEKKPGTFFDPSLVAAFDVLENIDVLADEHQVGDEGDPKSYKVRTLPPAIANKVWQIQTGGRGSVKAVSKIHKETDTITCYAELRDGERVISKQMDVPIPYTGHADSAFEAQRAANLKLGKCLAEVYRYAGIGYYPSPKDDEAEETSPFVTGVFKTEIDSMPAASVSHAAIGGITAFSSPGAHVSEFGTLQPHSNAEPIPSDEKIYTPAPDEEVEAKPKAAPKKKKKKKERKRLSPASGKDVDGGLPVNETAEAAKNTPVAAMEKEADGVKEPGQMIRVPEGYPTLEEAKATRCTAFSTDHPLYGDPKLKSGHHIKIYKQLRKEAMEGDGTEKGKELEALRVIIAANKEATDFARKYCQELFE